jgi:hypothetical protein
LRDLQNQGLDGMKTSNKLCVSEENGFKLEGQLSQLSGRIYLYSIIDFGTWVRNHHQYFRMPPLSKL